jgi:putative membrane protein
MMWGYGFSWGGMLLMTLGSVLSIALIVALVWAIIRWVNAKTTNSTLPYTSTPPSGPSALEILRQRYARGEIDTPTFEQMREQLESSGTRSYQQRDGNQSVISGH